MSKFFIILALFPLNAMAIQDGENLREMCREDVADLQLEYSNDQTVQMDRLDYSKKKIEMTTIELRSIEQELKLLQKKQEIEEFNYSLEQKIVGREYQLEQSRQLLKDYNTMHKVAEKKVVKAKRELQDFEKILKPVFYKKKVDNIDGEGYKFKLTYRSKCPAFNLVCGLGEKEKKAMTKIIPALRQKRNCERYVNLTSYKP